MIRKQMVKDLMAYAKWRREGMYWSSCTNRVIRGHDFVATECDVNWLTFGKNENQPAEVAESLAYDGRRVR